jgi:hypothetical protein
MALESATQERTIFRVTAAAGFFVRLNIGGHGNEARFITAQRMEVQNLKYQQTTRAL